MRRGHYEDFGTSITFVPDESLAEYAGRLFRGLFRPRTSRWAYARRVITVEAVEVRYADWEKSDPSDIWPAWLCEAVNVGRVFMKPSPCFGVYVKTPEGLKRAEEGSFIIRDVRGEVYPCKADIFHATYDRA